MQPRLRSETTSADILHKVTGIWLFTWISIDMCLSALCRRGFHASHFFYFIHWFLLVLHAAWRLWLNKKPSLETHSSSSAFACLNERTELRLWSGLGSRRLAQGLFSCTGRSPVSGGQLELERQRNKTRNLQPTSQQDESLYEVSVGQHFWFWENVATTLFYG